MSRNQFTFYLINDEQGHSYIVTCQVVLHSTFATATIFPDIENFGLDFDKCNIKLYEAFL